MRITRIHWFVYWSLCRTLKLLPLLISLLLLLNLILSVLIPMHEIDCLSFHHQLRWFLITLILIWQRYESLIIILSHYQWSFCKFYKLIDNQPQAWPCIKDFLQFMARFGRIIYSKKKICLFDVLHVLRIITDIF